MSAQRLLLLGGFELHDSRGTPLRLPTRKAEALLAYLALAPQRAHPRDALAGLLWSGSPQARARANLRQTLSLLNKALGPGVLASSARNVALAPEGLEVDVLAFCALAEGTTVEALERAVQCCRGDLLDAMPIDEAGFEDWLLAERASLRGRMVAVLARLAALHEACGATERAIGVAQRLLAFDPLEESAHRRLMRLYAALGRRGAALRQYEVCVNVLRRELDDEPDAETRALYDAVLRQRDEPGLPGRAAPARGNTAQGALPIGVAYATPLVGRGELLAGLVTLLGPVARGAGRVLALAGEAGIGKTRLAAELAARAAAQGFRVTLGRCHDSQRQDPYVPWIEALRGAGVLPGASLLDEIGRPWRRELARLLPELGGADDAPEVEGHLPGQSGRLAEAVVELLARLAQRAPLLVLIEDLHWADELSVHLLATLGRRLADRPVLIALTVRAEELAASAALLRVLRELDKAGQLTRIDLEPLSRRDTGALLACLMPAGTSEAAGARLAELVWRSSEGNPFVVIETLNAAGPRAALEAALADALPAPYPQRVRDLIAGHLELLGPRARQLAVVAAVAGGQCEFALLARAAGLPERSAAAALDELVRRRVLRASGEHFEFVHERIRHVLDESLLAPARRLAHLGLAEAYEALYGADAAQVCDRLAYHYSRGECTDKAVAYLARLAERAARAGAHEHALAALDEALDHLARRPSPNAARRRFELVFRKSRSALLLGRLEEVVAMLSAQQAYVDGAGDARTAGPYYVRLAATFSYLGDYARSAEHSTRALAEAGACGDGSTLGKAHSILALHHFWARPALGVRHGRQAVDLLAGANDAWWLGQAAWILGLNLSYQGRLDEGLAMQARAAAIGAAMADRRLQCSAAWATGFIRTLAGELDGAVTACRAATDLAPDPMARMVSRGMLALAHVERREADEAIALLDPAIAETGRFRIPRLHGLYLGFRAEAALLLGEAAEALVLAERGAALTRDSGYRYGLGWIQRIRARIAGARGDGAGLVDGLTGAARTFEDMAAPFETARTRLELAAWLASNGQPGAGVTLAARALAEFAALGLDGPAARARALLAEHAGQPAALTPPLV